MSGIFSIIGDIYRACEAGKELVNARAWASTATLALDLAALIAAALPIANFALGTHLEASQDQIESIGKGLADALFLLGVNRLHVAANPNAGRLPREPRD